MSFDWNNKAFAEHSLKCPRGLKIIIFDHKNYSCYRAAVSDFYFFITQPDDT